MCHIHVKEIASFKVRWKHLIVHFMQFLHTSCDWMQWQLWIYWKGKLASFVDLLCFCSVLCLLCFVHVCLYVLCGHLLGKGWPLGSRLWCLLWVCHFPIGILVSWVRCGTWLYRFLIFAPLLTFTGLLMDQSDHRSLKFDPDITSIATKPKVHLIRNYIVFFLFFVLVWGYRGDIRTRLHAPVERCR